MTNVETHTPQHLFLAATAVSKLRAGEPIAPKSCTRGTLGRYLTLVQDMHDALRAALSSQEQPSAVVEAMEAYWCDVRLDNRWRELVEAVDTLDITDAVQSIGETPEVPQVRAIIRGADEITEKPMEWLWYPYIPRHMLVMLDGDPGIGKSMMLLQVATNLSKGLPFLDQFGKPTLAADVDGPQTTLMLSAEDSLEYVMIPRLKQAGADLSRIKFMTGWLSADGTEQSFDLQEKHLPFLTQAIEDRKPALVILDPLVAYLGDIDMYRANQTRPVMAKLRKIAERYACTILGVRHPGKLDQGGPLMYRGQGNMDIIGAARSGL